MKEIDFLPEWYRCGQRRQISYRTQCLALGGIFLVMMVWSLTATHSISRAKAELANMGTKQAEAEHVSSELDQIRTELREFQKKAASLDEIDSKIDVANVLAELSFLVDKRVVLGRVEMTAEKLSNSQKNEVSAQSGTIVRVVREKSDKKDNLPLGDVRFKIVIAGVAADASDVAALMCKLEDSPYFRQVVLCYSRSAEAKNDRISTLKTETDPAKVASKSKEGAVEVAPAGNIQVTEFEINCYIANYQE